MRALPHPHIPAFASEGGVLRAEGLRSYLLELREAYTAYAPVPSVTLYVLSEGDWRALVPYPYGLAFQRSEGGEGFPSLLPSPTPKGSSTVSGRSCFP